MFYLNNWRGQNIRGLVSFDGAKHQDITFPKGAPVGRVLSLSDRKLILYVMILKLLVSVCEVNQY